MRLFLPLLSLVLYTSCQKLEKKEKPADPALRVSNYINDGKGGVFKNNKWYQYDGETRTIQSLQDVYSLKKAAILERGTFYKLQIMSYYENDIPGHLAIRIAEENGDTRELAIDASACGTEYTTDAMEYRLCLQDPQRNAYTYLNFKTLQVWSMSDEQAQTDDSWDIGFKRTDIKLNGGTSGPGNVTGALGYRNPGLENGTTDSETLRSASFSTSSQKAFEEFSNYESASYYPPDGIDEVIHKSMWYVENSGLRSANTSNWWIVRTSENGYIRFNVSRIDETTSDGHISTSIELSYGLQKKEDPSFPEIYQTWELPSFSTQDKVTRVCLDFENQAVDDCSIENPANDMKLLVFNKGQNRIWQITTSNGAYGPMNEDLISKIPSGEHQ